MGTILIGTSSWADKTVIASGWYPDLVDTPEARLRYYAAHFPLVEVDSSYYALPTARNAQLWAQRTPQLFLFDIKAFRLFTGHQTAPAVLPLDIQEVLGPPEKKNLYYRDLPEEISSELWRRFRSALEPLRMARKLGMVLFQFAPWFVYSKASFWHILHCAENLGDIPLAIEFRNKSWFAEKHAKEVLAFERENRFVHVIADEPQGFVNSIPSIWEVTERSLAVVRLHGWDAETWNKKGLSTATDRTNYLYSDQELGMLCEPVRRLAAEADEVHVLFNNCYRDNAQRNAADFAHKMNKSAASLRVIRQ